MNIDWILERLIWEGYDQKIESRRLLQQPRGGEMKLLARW